MMDLNRYKYSDKPYYGIKAFGIHPLSDEGCETYFGKTSSAHNYLQKGEWERLNSQRKSYERKQILSQNFTDNPPQNNQSVEVQSNIVNKGQSTGTGFSTAKGIAFDSQFYNNKKDTKGNPLHNSVIFDINPQTTKK